MALFGDEDGDVGPFVMAEGGEEWFPFTLDNLEMDRACSSLQEDSRPMDQVCVSLPQRILLFSTRTHPGGGRSNYYAHPA